MTLEQNHTNQVTVNNYIVFTFFFHLLFLLAASAVPEGRFIFWLSITLTVEILIMFRIFLLWTRYRKTNPKRYNSLQLYWMLAGFSVYSVIPFLRVTYNTIVFWPFLIGTVVLFLFCHLWRETIASTFVNPRKTKQLIMWPKALILIVILGIILLSILRFTPTHPDLGLIIFLYMLGNFMMFFAPPFTLKEEQINRLKTD